MKEPSFNIDLLEEMARSNSWKKVERVIKRNRSMSSHSIIQVATIYRRAYRLSSALSMLRPLVLKPDGSLNMMAETTALAEYSTCLIMLGRKRRALNILKNLKKDSPEVLFSWVTYHFSNANYSEALSELYKYVEFCEDPYWKKVGELNICSCLISIGLYEKAQNYLTIIQPGLIGKSHKLLKANAKELQAQIYIRQKKWPEAKESLRLAGLIMDRQNALYSLFIEKWDLVCLLKDGKKGEKDVKDFIIKAENLGHFYSIREVLFYWAYFSNQETLIEKIFYGTSSDYYRAFIKQQTGLSFNKREIVWSGNWFNHQVRNIFEFNRNPIPGLSLSSQEQRLLTALVDDFVEPKTVSDLFYDVYPGELFDSGFSSQKTYKVSQRLNKKLEKANVAIRVVNANSRYHLALGEGWGVCKLHPEISSLGLSSNEQSLVHRFKGQAFTRDDVMLEFSMKKATSLRWLKSLREKGLVERSGKGPSAHYKIADHRDQQESN